MPKGAMSPAAGNCILYSAQDNPSSKYKWRMAMNKRNEFKMIVPLVFRALGLAMSVAVVVLNLLHTAPLETQVTLLGFGMACLAIAVFDQEKSNER